jgi:hypothetical protein
MRMKSIRQVPLSWLKEAWRFVHHLRVVLGERPEPISPCSSAPQWATRMVRRGFGYVSFRIRIASIIMIVPVPLSVAPEPPSHESRCAVRRTYSSGSSVPGISR